MSGGAPGGGAPGGGAPGGGAPGGGAPGGGAPGGRAPGGGAPGGGAPGGRAPDDRPADGLADGLVLGADGLTRCAWACSTPDYTAYHDDEWGRVVRGETPLYERLTLEAFQSGLSWLTILRKREGFRAAFAGFDAEAVAGFGAADVARLMADPSIVRNRLKIQAAISNARAVVALREQGGLDALVWSHSPPRHERPRSRAELPATTPEAAALAKALKRRGFTFVGPTSMYAAMQACGLVDDHLAGCHRGGR